jgi:hypothetical protein
MVCVSARRPTSPALPAATVCIALVLAGCSAADQVGTASKPDVDLMWLGQGGGFGEWGGGGEYIYARSVKPRVLDVWKWHGSRLIQDRNGLDLGDETCVTWVSGNRYVCTQWDGSGAKPYYVAVRHAAASSVEHKWLLPEGWGCEHIQASRNGQYLGLQLGENSPWTPGHDSEHERAIIGLMNSDAETITWFPPLVMQVSGGGVRSVLPSDDGAYYREQ